MVIASFLFFKVMLYVAKSQASNTRKRELAYHSMEKVSRSLSVVLSGFQSIG